MAARRRPAVVNHSHAECRRFDQRVLTGPSNYMLAISKRLTDMVRSGRRGEELMHATRGDGDGRIHLA